MEKGTIDMWNGCRWVLMLALCWASIAHTLGQTATTHTVAPKQTWYGIARMHEVSVEALQAANSAIFQAGLQPGDILQIPQSAILPDLPTSILAPDTIPADLEPAVRPSLHCDDTLKVLAILPFQFDADTLMGGMDDPRVVRLRQISMEFYYGMRWAASSLRDAGFNVTLRVVDSAPDSLGNLWSLADVMWSDVVLGPLRRAPLDSAVEVTALLAKPHWALISNDTEALLEKGSHVFVAAPDEVAAARALGKSAALDHPDERVTLLYTGIFDAPLESAFVAGFEAHRDSAAPPLHKHLVTARFAEGVHVDDTTRTHIFAVPSGKSTRAMVAHLQNELLRGDTVASRLYMHPDVRSYDFIEPRLLDHTQLVTLDHAWMDWADSLSLSRIWPYRDATGTDPTDYAMLAHDAVLESAAWCASAADTLPIPPPPLGHRFEWISEGAGRGWRNQAWQRAQYLEGTWTHSGETSTSNQPQRNPTAKASSANPNPWDAIAPSTGP